MFSHMNYVKNFFLPLIPILILGLTATGCKAAELPADPGKLGELDPPKHEFRGAWLTTVVNLDWPVSYDQPVEEQKADAIAMLDSLKDIGINAVLFQVRGESDAFYASAYDPWSHWLTGEQGRAPDPFYDPLSFMIREAQQRGMELHAWINPYRVERRKGMYPLAGSNVSRREPGWILEFESRPGEYYTMLNPGIPEVRDYVTNVVVDILRRYDVDGIHFDDYFYPYSPVTDEDSLTFLEHNNVIVDIEDWRRFNVNELVAQVHDSIQTIAPHVTFGISPFAIRKNTDAGTDAFEGYYRLYADGLAWLEQRTIDYINPQLYFEFEHPRAPYAPLLEYWARVARENERHMYAGLAPYRIFPPHDWSLEQALAQLRLNIDNGNVQGNIFFRTEHLIANPKGYTDVLRNELYRYPALTPSLPWKSQDRPPPVERPSATWSDDGRVILTWGRPDPTKAAAMPGASESYAEAVRYVVYRTDMPAEQFAEHMEAMEREDGGLTLTGPAFYPQNMVDVTGQRQLVDRWSGDRKHAVYIVTAVSHNSVESYPLTVWTWTDDDGFHYVVR